VSMDISDSITPKSDQLNAEDLLTGPRTVTVAEVRRGSVEQPVEIVTEEFGPGRPFKPSKTVRRILVSAWGAEASKYVGRRMTLYRDPAVRFGGQDVGGIRVSHLSHIEKRITLHLTVTRGKRAPYVVEPLPDAPSRIPADLEAKVRASDDPKWLGKTRTYLDRYAASEPDRVAELQALITGRVTELEREPDPTPETGERA